MSMIASNKKTRSVAGLISCRRYIPRFEAYTTTSDKSKLYVDKMLNFVGFFAK